MSPFSSLSRPRAIVANRGNRATMRFCIRAFSEIV